MRLNCVAEEQMPAYLLCRCNLKVLRKKSCIDEWEQKNIEHQKFTQLPHHILMVHPLPHISYRAAILCIFMLFATPKTPTFVLRFYTFSYFISTFPKILVLLLSYFSTQRCQKAWFCEAEKRKIFALRKLIVQGKTLKKIWQVSKIHLLHRN
jgi:hypothetical protein